MTKTDQTCWVDHALTQAIRKDIYDLMRKRHRVDARCESVTDKELSEIYETYFGTKDKDCPEGRYMASTPQSYTTGHWVEASYQAAKEAAKKAVMGDELRKQEPPPKSWGEHIERRKQETHYERLDRIEKEVTHCLACVRRNADDMILWQRLTQEIDESLASFDEKVDALRADMTLQQHLAKELDEQVRLMVSEHCHQNEGIRRLMDQISRDMEGMSKWSGKQDERIDDLVKELKETDEIAEGIGVRVDDLESNDSKFPNAKIERLSERVHIYEGYVNTLNRKMCQHESRLLLEMGKVEQKIKDFEKRMVSHDQGNGAKQTEQPREEEATREVEADTEEKATDVCSTQVCEVKGKKRRRR